MILPLFASLALAHGGEDHGAPPPPAAAHAEGASIATWSSEFDVVLRLPDAHPGEPVRATLLVADHGTSRPIAEGTAKIAFDGPAPFTVEVSAGPSPGIWPFEVTFPAEGEWDGGITLIAGDRADALGLPPFHVERPEPVADGRRLLSIGAVLAALACGLVAGALGGFALGRWRRVVAAAVGLLFVGATARGHGGEDHGAPPPPAATAGSGLTLPLDGQFLLDLRTVRAARRPFTESVRALGTTIARPGGSAEIHAPVTGIVAFPEGRTFLPGETVRAGDVLATIAETLPSSERSSVVEARTGALVRLAEARKRLEVATADLERARSLEAVLSERERLEREKAVEVAREEVRQAEIAVGALGNASTTVLRSPLTGRLSALLARPGDVVSPADVLFRVTDAGGLWVEAQVPETRAGQLRIGGAATVVSDAHPDEALPATVLDPGLEADPESGTLRVVLALEQAVEWLVPGMTVTASIGTGAPREALVVPDPAVIDLGGESVVFVKTGPETFELRRVRVGALSGLDREILAGLAEGERVVVQGTTALRSLAGR